eukprot:m.238458 g.238458  ORF g.238458 m.238458 type:complete len:478 (-) comp18968_c0_seq2:287-1720(-)
MHQPQHPSVMDNFDWQRQHSQEDFLFETLHLGVLDAAVAGPQPARSAAPCANPPTTPTTASAAVGDVATPPMAAATPTSATQNQSLAQYDTARSASAEFEIAQEAKRLRSLEDTHQPAAHRQPAASRGKPDALLRHVPDVQDNHTTSAAAAGSNHGSSIAQQRPRRSRKATIRYNDDATDELSEEEHSEGDVGSDYSGRAHQPRVLNPQPVRRQQLGKRKRLEPTPHQDDTLSGSDEPLYHTQHDDGAVEVISPQEEAQLRLQLKRRIKELRVCTEETRHLHPAERKKLRNRKASCVSRLRKKLSLCDLQHRFDRACEAVNALEASCRFYEQGYRVLCAQVQQHNPAFVPRQGPPVPSSDDDLFAFRDTVWTGRTHSVGGEGTGRRQRRRRHSKRRRNSAHTDDNDNDEDDASDGSDASVEDPDAVYCLCRTNREGQMIQCDSCCEWFHLDCVGVSQEEAKARQTYSCPNCARKPMS